MNYNSPHILRGELGNNVISFEERGTIRWEDSSLFIPSLVTWGITDVILGTEIVFEEIEDGSLKSCKGLKHFIRLPYEITTTIFDNHNHALYFWLEAMRRWIISPWVELIHIDEHSDLWPNENKLDRERAINDEHYAWEFTNFSCNVGNYILPAMDSELIGSMIRIENEFELDTYMNYTPAKNSVLNLDLDFFAPEMDFISEKKKIQLIQNLLPKVKCITIATSPYFIDQWLAIEKLKKIFESKREWSHPMIKKS